MRRSAKQVPLTIAAMLALTLFAGAGSAAAPSAASCEAHGCPTVPVKATLSLTRSADGSLTARAELRSKERACVTQATAAHGKGSAVLMVFPSGFPGESHSTIGNKPHTYFTLDTNFHPNYQGDHYDLTLPKIGRRFLQGTVPGTAPAKYAKASSGTDPNDPSGAWEVDTLPVSQATQAEVGVDIFPAHPTARNHLVYRVNSEKTGKKVFCKGNTYWRITAF